MEKINIDLKNKPTEVFGVKKTPKGYLVTAEPFKKDEEPKKVFHVTNNNVILK